MYVNSSCKSMALNRIRVTGNTRRTSGVVHQLLHPTSSRRLNIRHGRHTAAQIVSVPASPTPSSSLRSRLRPRESCDATVPVGVFMIAAISW
jgi:hypothetical protein